VLAAGASLGQAKAAMLLVHGRGASAEDILSLAAELDGGNIYGGKSRHGESSLDMAYLAPQAANFTWYPQRFLAPLEQNEPWLTSALKLLGVVIGQIEAAGIPAERTLLVGFSQGACLALEYAARNARRWGGVAALSGGLIGPQVEPGRYPGTFSGTPIFLGCSDVDPHIPAQRVLDSATQLEKMEARVDARLYPGMAHTINDEELGVVRSLAAAISA
jgi:predicted esterase